MDHNDGRYDGDIGELRGKQIVTNKIEHVGKEASNLEESEVIVVLNNDYVIYDNKTEQKIIKIIEKLTPKQAKAIGISKRNMRYLIKKVKEGTKIIFKRKTLSKLQKL